MKKIVIVLLSVINVVALILAYKSYKDLSVVEANRSSIAINSAATKYYTNKKKNLTVADYEQKLQKQVKNLNLDNIENEIRQKYVQGFTDAYSANTEEKFDAMADKLSDSLVEVLASKVLSNTAPTESQAGKIPMSEKLNSVNVSFGKYDLSSEEIPIMITVDYKVPESLLQSTDSTDSVKTNNDLTKKAIYMLTYNVKSGKQTSLTYDQLAF